MAKGKVTTNITKNEYAFIDGTNGKELSPEEFARKYGNPMPGGYQRNSKQKTS